MDDGDEKETQITHLCTDIMGIVGTRLATKDIRNARLAHACFNGLTSRTTQITLFLSWSKLATIMRRLMLGFGGVFGNLQIVRLVLEDGRMPLDVMEEFVNVLDAVAYNVEIISEHAPIVNERYLPLFCKIAQRVKRIDIMGNPLVPNFILNLLMQNFAATVICIRVVANGAKVVPPPVYMPHNIVYKLEVNENDVLVCTPSVYSAIAFGKDVILPRWYTRESVCRLQRLSLWVGARCMHLFDIISRTADHVEIVLCEIDFLDGLEVLFWFVEHGRKNKIVIRNITSDMYAQARVLIEVSPYKNVSLYNVDYLLYSVPVQDIFAYIRRDISRKIQAIVCIAGKSHIFLRI